MDITELILEKLNHNLTNEKEEKLKAWLKESYTHEAMMSRLERMKIEGEDFNDVRKLNPVEAWQKVLKKDNK